MKPSFLVIDLKEYNFKYKNICTFQQYLEYNLNLPIYTYRDFFDSNGITYSDPFKIDKEENKIIVDKIVRKSYKYIK